MAAGWVIVVGRMSKVVSVNVKVEVAAGRVSVDINVTVDGWSVMSEPVSVTVS